MKKNDKTFIFILLLMLCACLVSWRLYFKVYRQSDTVNIHLLPKSIGEWTSEELTITEDEYAILETRNAFARRYKTPLEKEVIVFIVYSQNNRKVSHPPEVCYRGSGVSVVGNQHATFAVAETNDAIKTNRLFLEQGNFHQIAYYWFKVGDTFTSNYWKQQFLIVLKTLLGQNSSSALIRVSSPVKEIDEVAAEANIQEFSRLLVPLLYKYLP